MSRIFGDIQLFLTGENRRFSYVFRWKNSVFWRPGDVFLAEKLIEFKCNSCHSISVKE